MRKPEFTCTITETGSKVTILVEGKNIPRDGPEGFSRVETGNRKKVSIFTREAAKAPKGEVTTVLSAWILKNSAEIPYGLAVTPKTRIVVYSKANISVRNGKIEEENQG